LSDAGFYRQEDIRQEAVVADSTSTEYAEIRDGDAGKVKRREKAGKGVPCSTRPEGFLGQKTERVRTNRRNCASLASRTHKEVKNKPWCKQEAVVERKPPLSEAEKIITSKKIGGGSKEGGHRPSREDRKMMVNLQRIAQLERKEKGRKYRLCPNEETAESEELLAFSIANLPATDRAQKENGVDDQDSQETAELEELTAFSLATLRATDRAQKRAGR
jgi:hypothetical protein